MLKMKTKTTYETVKIKIDSIELDGNLRHAKKSNGIVLFSHGSGSSRWSSRNNYVADLLMQEGFSSLLFDLLTYNSLSFSSFSKFSMVSLLLL